MDTHTLGRGYIALPGCFDGTQDSLIENGHVVEHVVVQLHVHQTVNVLAREWLALHAQIRLVLTKSHKTARLDLHSASPFGQQEWPGTLCWPEWPFGSVAPQ